MKTAATFITTAFFTLINTAADSVKENTSVTSEDPSIIFREAFENDIALLDEGHSTTVTKDEDDFGHLLSQLGFEEFLKVKDTTRPKLREAINERKTTALTKRPTKTTTNTTTTLSTTTLTTTTLTTTRTTETTGTTKATLLNKQRGILDLLYPPPSVRNIKKLFDTVKRMLSYTFR